MTKDNTKKEVLCPECGSINNINDNFCKECSTTLLLNNKYFLLKILGENIGTTYLAIDNTSETNELVVIKELSLRRVDKWKTQELFKREGAILSQLNHEAIPKFVDEFETGIGRSARSYLVIENIEGISLRKEYDKKRYTEAEVIEISIEIATILDYLHNLMPPVIHRDIKLSNLMRKSDGSLTLIDFGSVKDAMRDKNATISGTMGFMAPEQLTGSPVIASDFYSLGAVLLVLLSRKEIDEMTENGIDLNWQSSVHVSNKMLHLLDRLLEKDYKKRLNSLSELEEILLTDKYDKRQEVIPPDRIETKVENKVVKKKELSPLEFMAMQDDSYLDDFTEDVDELFARERYRSHDGSVQYRFKDPKMQMISFIATIIIGIIVLIIKVMS